MASIAALALALSIVPGLGEPVTAHENELFKKNIGLYLTRDSWNDSLAYLHGHFLMVPLHAAFLLDQKDWQSQFESQYKRLVKVPHDQLCRNPLSRLQYLYTVSRFLALSAKTGRQSDVNADLNSYLTSEITDRWLNQDAIGFDVPHFRGVKERVEHKLTLFTPKLSYYAAITDEEAFLFAEAADLLYVERKTGKRNAQHDTLADIVRVGTTVYHDRGKFTRDGGWLFDAGAWADHPDSKYAGNSQISPAMQPSRVSDITMDTSHFHRFALFVNSMRDASAPGTGDYKYFDSIRVGLAKQLNKVCLKKPSSDFSGYRLTNFMNGMNGVYRYDSNKAVGEGRGYGPYELSGTFLMGWWSFLGDPDVDKAYGDIAKTFPLSETVMKVYQGPTYEAPPRKAKSWYENGLAELLTSLGSKMPPFLKAAPDKGVAKQGSSVIAKKVAAKKITAKKPTKKKPRRRVRRHRIPPVKVLSATVEGGLRDSRVVVESRRFAEMSASNDLAPRDSGLRPQ